jgi:uncharacterized protein (TIGR00369 family)
MVVSLCLRYAHRLALSSLWLEIDLGVGAGHHALMAEPSDERVNLHAEMNRRFMEFVPHNKALGLEVVRFGDGEAVMSLPYADRLVGNPETGVLHGGAITSLMDAACGAAVFMKLTEPMPIATLELRIDYLRPATPHQAVVARAHCYKVTRDVAFVRCDAFHAGAADDPIATAAGTFMLSTQYRRKGWAQDDGPVAEDERGDPS